MTATKCEITCFITDSVSASSCGLFDILHRNIKLSLPVEKTKYDLNNITPLTPRTSLKSIPNIDCMKILLHHKTGEALILGYAGCRLSCANGLHVHAYCTKTRHCNNNSF